MLIAFGSAQEHNSFNRGDKTRDHLFSSECGVTVDNVSKIVFQTLSDLLGAHFPPAMIGACGAHQRRAVLHRAARVTKERLLARLQRRGVDDALALHPLQPLLNHVPLRPPRAAGVQGDRTKDNCA